MPSSIKKENLQEIFLFVLLAAGALFMLRDFFAFRSLWLDEAALALNLSRGLGGFTEPLGYGQMAPLFLLYTTKILTLILGLKDWVVRLLPLFAGIGSLAVFYLILKRLPRYETRVFALSLFILSDRIIYYATEFKQYSLDIFFSLLITLIYIKIVDDELDIKKAVAFILIGITAMWFSYTSIIVIAVAAVMIFIKVLQKRKKREITFSLISFLLLIMNLLLEYFLYYRNLTSGLNEMDYYWDFGFMPFPLTSLRAIWWPFKNILGIFSYTYKLDGGLISGISPLLKTIFGLLLFALFVLGAVKITRKRRDLLIITIMVFLVSLVLSALRIYPFYERTVIFTAPFIIFFIAGGLAAFSGYLKRIHISLSVIFLIFFFIIPFSLRIYYLIEPPYKSEIKPVITYYEENMQDGDLLYVEEYYIHQFEFYRPEGGIDLMDQAEIEEAQVTQDVKRVWAIGDIGELREQGKIIEYFKINTLSSRIAEKIPFKSLQDRMKVFNDPGVEATLFEFRN